MQRIVSKIDSQLMVVAEQYFHKELLEEVVQQVNSAINLIRDMTQPLITICTQKMLDIIAQKKYRYLGRVVIIDYK